MNNINKIVKMSSKIRIGYIPEHFSTPIAFADKYGFYKKHGLENYELIPYPSGSGHLIQSLKDGEIDIVVGLTEAFVRGIANGDSEYKIVGEYVKSPLCWSISTGKQRDDLQTIEDLKKKGNNHIGVSRIGSGSYVMSFVLQLKEKFNEPFEFKVLNNFKNLRDSVNNGTTDAFMWEYFTTKKYYDNNEIKKIGEIYTPWSSWVVTSSNKAEVQSVISSFLSATQEGISYYNKHKEESLDYILNNLDYNNRTDIEQWMARVEFSSNVAHVNWDENVVETAKLLASAGVVTNLDLGLQRLEQSKN